jgi:transcriptional regulator with XRE-family HTH domain
MDIKKKFGKNLKRLRLEKGISQESLALSADLDRTYIPSIEKGERNVSITVVEKLCTDLNVNVLEFFKD